MRSLLKLKMVFQIVGVRQGFVKINRILFQNIQNKWHRFQILAPSVKVLVGNDVSFKIPAISKCLTCDIPTAVFEKDTFFNVSSIIPSPDTNFCILTLKESVDFTETMQPLCLPEIDSDQKDRITGTVLGFGYDNLFPSVVKNNVKTGILKERKMERSEITVYSSTECAKLLALDSWALKKKLIVETGTTLAWWQEYLWLERYIQNRNTQNVLKRICYNKCFLGVNICALQRKRKSYLTRKNINLLLNGSLPGTRGP